MAPVTAALPFWMQMDDYPLGTKKLIIIKFWKMLTIEGITHAACSMYEHTFPHPNNVEIDRATNVIVPLQLAMPKLTPRRLRKQLDCCIHRRIRRLEQSDFSMCVNCIFSLFLPLRIIVLPFDIIKPSKHRYKYIFTCIYGGSNMCIPDICLILYYNLPVTCWLPWYSL